MMCCTVTGQGAGVAAAVSVKENVACGHARAALYVELQRLMQEDPPVIYLYQPVTFAAINPKVKNYKPRAAEDYFPKDVSIDQ